jgi:5'(3')-deoxyribonucleotidase
MNKRLTIGVDFDDVVADLLPAWLARFNAEHSTRWSTADLTQWDLHRDLGCEPEAIYKHLTPSIYDDVQPVPAALEALHAIEQLGHDVVIVTSVQGDAPAANAMLQAKVQWLLRHGCGKQALTAIPVGPSWPDKNKSHVPVDWLVDDNVKNVETFAGYGIVVTRPHNRAQSTPRKRVRGLQDIVPLLAFNPPIYSGAEQLQKPAGSLIGLPCVQGEGIPLTVGAPVRKFDSGATRDTDTDKLDYEGFLSPLVLERYAKFMHMNRHMRDGSLRDSDNWQKGIPRPVYVKSLCRHFMSVWKQHRVGITTVEQFENELCAILFNTMGYLHEHLKEASNGTSK